jgi:hypothetical protein
VANNHCRNCGISKDYFPIHEYSGLCKENFRDDGGCNYKFYKYCKREAHNVDPYAVLTIDETSQLSTVVDEWLEKGSP